jgi:hypothetical protein
MKTIARFFSFLNIFLSYPVYMKKKLRNYFNEEFKFSFCQININITFKLYSWIK